MSRITEHPNPGLDPVGLPTRSRSWGLVLAVATVLVVWLAAFWVVDSLASDTSADTPPLSCGVVVGSDGAGGVHLSESVRVVIGMDEEWVESTTGDAVVGARRLLADASRPFRSAGMRFITVGVVEWNSPNDVEPVSDLLAAAREALPLGEADIAIALTGQHTTGGDGRAETLGRYALVRRHDGRHDRDALVLSHEIGHLFGAEHACDVPEVGGMMNSEGFSGMHFLCPCTRRVLNANAHRLHAVTP